MENQVSSNQVKEPNALFKFIRSIFRFIKGYFILVGVVITLIMFLLIYAGLSHKPSSSKVTVDEAIPYVLELTLRGPILDRALNAEEQFFTEITGEGAGIELIKLSNYLKEAAKKENLRGIFVRLDGVSGSLANFDELRSLFETFKKSEKDLQFWMEYGDYLNYYLASSGNKISMPPVSSLVMTGPTFGLTYFGEGLKKLGVEIDVIRSGKYKSAFEAYIKNTPSPATLEMYGAMEQSIRTSIAEKIATGRGLTNSPVETVSGWFKQSMFTTTDVQKLGIIDALEYKGAALSRMKNELGVANSYPFSSSLVKQSTNPFSGDSDGIALIEAVGTIVTGGKQPNTITYQSMAKQLKWAKDDPSIKGVVLRISSPGGAAVSSDLIWRDVKSLSEVKPVVVSMGTYAASGGYYIAAAANKIIALPNTITGSIGVIGMVPNFKNFEEKYGVSFHMVTSSNRKGLLNGGEPASEEDKKILGDSIDEIYKEFLNRVSTGRNMPVSDVHAIAQGRVWTGSQAKEIGLVDQLGTLNDALAEVKKLASLDVNTHYPIKRYVPKGANLMECLKFSTDWSQCVGAQGARIKSLISTKMITEEERKIQRVKGLIEHVKHDPVQTLWDGYYTL